MSYWDWRIWRKMMKHGDSLVIYWDFVGTKLVNIGRELMMVDGKHHYSTTLYLDIKPIHVGWNPLSDAYFMGIYSSIYLHIFPSDPTYSNSRTIHGHGQTPFRRPCQVPLVLHVCGAFHCAHGLGIPEALPRRWDGPFWHLTIWNWMKLGIDYLIRW